MLSSTRRASIGVILLLATALHVLNLEREGLANLYYAATVRSMLTGWRAFFFASFDPAGFVTVDKPPLGFWIQTVSAGLLGFQGLSLLLPQAFAGVLSVAVVYRLVGRTFGHAAGALAALILALSPVSIAANRNNTQDSLVVLTCLLGAYATLRAVQGARTRWLLLGAGFLGLGFEIKMLQAYLVLPALFGIYALVGRPVWWRRVGPLIAATGILLAVSMAWPLAVDLIPPEQRPYIGSSGNNTVMGLILGHNGAERLLAGGLRALLGQQPIAPRNQQPAPPGQSQPLPFQPPSGGPPSQGTQPGRGQAGPAQPQAQPPQVAGGGPGNTGETGAPGPLRLFGRELGGQTSWLLPLAALGCLAAAWQTRPGRRSPRHQALLFWALWLIPQLAFFSIANLFHRYYLEMLAPAIAALAGAGLVALWDDYRSPGWRGWLLPIALLATAALHLYLLHPFPDWDRRLSPIIVAATAVAAAALAGLRLAHWDRKRPWQVALAALGVGALLLAPAVWGALPVWQGGNVMLPAAGPEGAVQRRGPAGAPRADRLTTYLLANRQGASFLAATFSANVAAPFILATGQPVMAMGGFSGGDRILTVQDLERMVRDRQVRFFVFEGNQQPDLERWIESRCRAVPPNLWQGGQAQPGLATPGNVRGLYDCGNMGQ